MRRRLVTLASLALVVAACGGDASDPAAVLADYEEARNSGDVDAVMALYAEDAVVRSHPLNEDEATGVAEIRVLEEQVPGIQGSTGGIEFVDLVVSGNVVTFDEVFHNAQGDCFSGGGNQVTVEDGKITLFVWGTEDTDLCG